MQYLSTPDELKQNGTKLGLFTNGSTYSDFMNKAREAKVPNPALGLAIKFRPGMHMLDETAYPITAEEWNQFLRDVPTYCAETPTVYAVDGSKFTMPI